MKIYYKIICFFIIFNLILFMTYSKSYATFTQVNDIESTLSNIINYHLSEASQSEDASNDDINDDINDEDSSYEDVGDDDVTNDEENSDTDVNEDDIDDGDSGDDDYIDGDDLDQSFGSSTDDEDDGDGDEEDYSDDEDYDEEDGEEDDNSVSISSQQPNVSSSYDLPKTGISSTLIISMLLIALFGIYSFYKFSNQDF